MSEQCRRFERRETRETVKQINFIDEIIVDCFAGGGYKTGVKEVT